MKRAAPRTTRALAALAAVSVLLAGVAVGAHRCEMGEAMPCCRSEAAAAVTEPCCATLPGSDEPSPPALWSAFGAAIHTRADAFADRGLAHPSPYMTAAPAPRLERHPPRVLRI